MTIPHDSSPNPSPRPLRLWPGVAAALVIVLMRYLVPLVLPGALVAGILAGMAGALVIALWWLFFSRAAWVERLGALVLIVALVMATSRVVHPSIATGMMGLMFFMFTIPAVSVALVAWAVVTRGVTSRPTRAVALVAIVLVACGIMAMLRTDGVVGDGGSQLAWRWTKTPEQQLLARADDPKPVPPPPVVPAPAVDAVKPEPANTPSATAAAPAAVKPEAVVPSPTAPPAEWPGFRGAKRDGVIRGVRIETDWTKSPPVEVWRRPVGPGWSSFAVRGDLLYTQEQRGGDEVVTAYKVSTGEPVWRHRDAARFWESNGGAGPRATPTLSNGRLYAFGATGILNALDAKTGAVVWSRNVASDTGRAVPDWGFSSSPLVIDDAVIVAASGTLSAYDAATGGRRWVGPVERGSYSSPHRVTVDGVDQILLLSGSGATSVAPASGAVLWEHAWPGGTTIVQPAMATNSDVLVNNLAGTGGVGTRRLAIAHRDGGWSVEERWTSIGLKPYFNDFVVHKGYAFGFDGSILSCIDLEDGTRKWKGGRYGYGQLVLLADQDLLLVLSEEGQLALVSATADKHTEIARFTALEGKTWNHPVLVGDLLLVRNDHEMAAFRLTLAGK